MTEIFFQSVENGFIHFICNTNEIAQTYNFVTKKYFVQFKRY